MTVSAGSRRSGRGGFVPASVGRSRDRRGLCPGFWHDGRGRDNAAPGPGSSARPARSHARGRLVPSGRASSSACLSRGSDRGNRLDGEVAGHGHPAEGQRLAHQPSASRRSSGTTAACASSTPRSSTPTTRPALMKSITPDRCQQELQQKGGADFAIEYVDGVPVPRRHLQAEGHHRHGAAADPEPVPDVRADRHAGGHPLADRPAARAAPRHRADRVRQDDQPGVDDQLHQRQLRPAHHHAGRPDRVLPQAQEVHGQPARDRHRRAGLQGGHPPGAADGPGRDPRRRNARPGDDPRGHRGRRDRPLVFGTLHTSGAASARSTASSTCSRRTSRTRSARSSRPAAHRRAVAGAVAAEARRADRRLRDDGGHARHPEPDPREQDVPHRLVDPDRPQARHVPARRVAVPAVEGGPVREGRGAAEVEPSRPNWRPRSPRPSAGSTTRTRRTRTRTRTTRTRTRTTTTRTTTAVARRQ